MTLIGDFVTGQPVTFQRLRKLLFDQGGGIQEGILNTGDLKVSQRGAGANMTVDVAAGFAWVQIDTGTNNGLTHITSDAVANVGPFTAAHATLPRLDQVILRYNDTAIPTGSGNTPTLEVLTGTATAGATLDTRTGAAALPNDCLRIGDVLVPPTSTSVVTANIRDRRPWVRGFYYAQTGNGAANVVTTATSDFGIPGIVDNRMECSGVPVDLLFSGWCFHSTAGGWMRASLLLDGALAGFADMNSGTANGQIPFAARKVVTPAPGSHTFGVRFSSPGGVTGNLGNNSTTGAPTYTTQEVVRPNASN